MSAAPRSDQRRIAVVYNPVKVDAEKLRAAVAEREAEHGYAATLWLETTEDEPGQNLARQAADEKVDAVLVAGGDGTVRAASEGLIDSGLPMTLLPAGTGNLLARNLGIAVNRMDEAVDTVFDGDDRTIDAGIATIFRTDGTQEEHAFIVMIGIGIDAKMIAATNPELKKRVGWLAYVEAIARIVRDVDAVRLTYTLDGSPPRSTTVHTLIVGNCGSLPGGVLLMPDAVIDDGLLDIVGMRPRNFAGWVRVSTAVFWENGVVRKT
ncbi:MAG TPA: diacylglycerol kinase family protein, partial [Microcella sp.]|nr:diacylglycerol kinase family protein [Microcella sp.]